MLKKLEGFAIDTEIYWCSRTIAVIADPNREILLIGGTKPSANSEKFAALSRVSKAISTERLGTRFSQIINSSTEKFWSKTKDMKSQSGKPLTSNIVEALQNDEVDTLYDNAIVVTATSRRSWDDLMSPPNNPFFLWAFDGGSFKLVPPCLRCQWLYYSWLVASKPSNTSEKKASLQGIRGRKMEYTPGGTPPYTYCAETIAAAKVYLLYHGDVVLM